MDFYCLCSLQNSSLKYTKIQFIKLNLLKIECRRTGGKNVWNSTLYYWLVAFGPGLVFYSRFTAYSRYIFIHIIQCTFLKKLVKLNLS